MRDAFLIHIDCAEGSLQRLIGLIERRGFHIADMSVSGAGAHREVHVAVRGREPGRCVQALGRQIDKLVGARRLATSANGELLAEETAPCPV